MTESSNKSTNPRKDQNFRDMCLWIERELFGYDENQHLHKGACGFLQGLRKGQGYANNSHDQYGNYSVEVIFNTFKIQKVNILRSIKGKEFTSEDKKMAYICRIVEKHLNDMYTRMKNAKESEKKIDHVNLDAVKSETAVYQRQTADSNSDKFEDLW